MNRTLIAAVGLLAIVSTLASIAPAQDEKLANAVVAARKHNAELLREYNWNCRTEILVNKKMQDLRIDLVSVNSDGQLSHSLLNDQHGKLPGGFLRHAIAQNQQKQSEQTVKDIREVVDKYTLPSAGKIIAFIVQADVQPLTTPDGQSLLQVAGSDVVMPGDTFTMVFDGQTLQPTTVHVTTTANGDHVTLTGTFKTLKSGLNCLQYATAEVPSKQLSVMIHNYDFVPAD